MGRAREKLLNIGACTTVAKSCSSWPWAAPRALFAQILRRIERLRPKSPLLAA